MSESSVNVHRWMTRKLRECLVGLDSGSRPSGGAESGQGEVFSLGGEHIDDEGCFDFSNSQFVPLSHYEAIKVEADVAVGDILINKDGAKTGKVALVRPGFPFSPCCINEHVFRLRARTEVIEADSLFYFMVGHEGQRQIARNVQGSAQGGINRTFAKHVSIPHPESRAERREIVKLLDQVEDAITCKRSELNRAQRLKTALMQQLFTRGIPGRHTRFKQTKIGVIPEEGDLKRGRECFQLGGYSGLAPELVCAQGDALYLKVDDFNTEGNETVLGTAAVRFNANQNPDLQLFSPGAIVFAKRGAALLKDRVRLLGVTSAVDPNLMVMLPKPDAVSTKFLFYFLAHFKLGRLCEDAGIPQLNNRDLYPKLFPIPSDEEQLAIVDLLEAADETNRAVDAELKAVRRLKTSLLQNLLTGKVRIRMEG